jgi:Ca2+-binding EF-hand superfamily protein
MVDSNGNGYLTKDEFYKLCEDHEFFATNKELDLLIERFDRDKDGRVTYSEFFAETSPKEVY